jgi:hypothetical protein
LADQPEYRFLFELHLNGVDEQRGAANVTKWPDGARKPRWDPVQAFFQDRAVGSTGQLSGNSISSMEHLLQEIRALRRKQPTETLLLKQEHESQEILSRIRNRVAAFANAVEVDSRRSQGPPPPGSSDAKVFLGHGRSNAWRELKEFLEERVRLRVVEFSREPTAGIPTAERLEQMLSESHFAFLVLTAEDQLADETLHARENVVHEAGLFQGRLGFRRAIIVLEDGCQEFSNIHGLGQLRFRHREIANVFEEVRRVLEREGVVLAS